MKRNYSIPTTYVAHIESTMLMASGGSTPGGVIKGINDNIPEDGHPIPPSAGR